MVSINTLEEIENSIQTNQLKINVLNETNAALNNRREIQSTYEALRKELNDLEEQESQRREQYNLDRKNELIRLEQLSEKLCKDQMKLMHQIEHINWHISRAHPHDLSTPIEHPPAFPKSCQSSSSALVLGSHHHPHHHHTSHAKAYCSGKPSANMGQLQISAERLIKTIAELRRKICMTKHSLEQEIERKRCAEKNLTELRREVSKQKKMMSMRRCVPLPAITSVKKCVK